MDLRPLLDRFTYVRGLRAENGRLAEVVKQQRIALAQEARKVESFEGGAERMRSLVMKADARASAAAAALASYVVKLEKPTKAAPLTAPFKKPPTSVAKKSGKR